MGSQMAKTISKKNDVFGSLIFLTSNFSTKLQWWKQYFFSNRREKTRYPLTQTWSGQFPSQRKTASSGVEALKLFKENGGKAPWLLIFFCFYLLLYWGESAEVKGQPQGVVLFSFYRVCPKDWTQVARLYSKSPYLTRWAISLTQWPWILRCLIGGHPKQQKKSSKLNSTQV